MDVDCHVNYPWDALKNLAFCFHSASEQDWKVLAENHLLVSVHCQLRGLVRLLVRELAVSPTFPEVLRTDERKDKARKIGGKAL